MVSLIKSYGIYILLGLLVSVSLNWYVNLGKAVTLNASSSTVQTKISNTQIKLSFSKAVKLAAPSVVNLFTSKVVFVDQEANTGLLNTIKKEPRISKEAGSGVIISANGYIVTNYHVIKDAKEIIVTLNSGKTYPAVVVGNDTETDLSILKIDVKKLAPIVFAPPENIEVGDIVLAIGNPFGQGQSVSMGIVSATGKDRIGLNTYENFIQTDAAINPGNSGGALVNQSGELVGINSAIFSRSGGSQGIGFAIPVSTVKNILLQVVDKGYVTRDWLGLEGTDITKEGKKRFNLTGKGGVFVTGVYEYGPAYKAGIKAGDILLVANDIVIKDVHTILRATEKFMPGSMVKLIGQRKGQVFTTELVVQQRPIPN
jgi:S1-C subfamily serine protease